jgi:carbon monoxide dehydrogenase subunit G
MLKTALIVVAIVIAALLAYAAIRPDTFSVQRSTRVNAPPAMIFAIVNDFHRWTEWSPWEKLDPAMTRTLSGAASGPGAVYEWRGNGKVGAGRMEILASAPASAPTSTRQVTMKLDFIKPFEGHNIAEFTLVPQGAGTDVTWAMHGPTPFISKLMQVFVNMDSMIGKDFAAGLANLKARAEK